MSFLRAFVAFWYDFVIGDDWKIAAYVGGAVAAAGLAAAGGLSDGLIAVGGSALVVSCFALGLWHDVRSGRK